MENRGERRPVMVAGAPLQWSRRLTALAAAANPLLAADSGADHLARIGLRPSAVIGDLDSISAATRDWLGEEILIPRPEQDRTDLDKALEHAFATLDLAELTVLAAMGGRPDHEVGNLGLLARLHMGDRLRFEGQDHRILALEGEAVLAARPGEVWSFWSYDPTILVSVEGVRWPVRDAPLDASGRPSISNRAVDNQVRVVANGGPVVVMRWFDQAP
jgi:thiamine pyrophosphokinase